MFGKGRRDVGNAVCICGEIAAAEKPEGPSGPQRDPALSLPKVQHETFLWFEPQAWRERRGGHPAARVLLSPPPKKRKAC